MYYSYDNNYGDVDPQEECNQWPTEPTFRGIAGPVPLVGVRNKRIYFPRKSKELKLSRTN